jgi:hypothetical protein
VHLGLLVMALVSAVLALEISWPTSILFSGLDRREASERLWVLAPVVIVCCYLLFVWRDAQSYDHEFNETDLRLRVTDWLFVLFVVKPFGWDSEPRSLQLQRWSSARCLFDYVTS